MALRFSKKLLRAREKDKLLICMVYSYAFSGVLSIISSKTSPLSRLILNNSCEDFRSYLTSPSITTFRLDLPFLWLCSKTTIRGLALAQYNVHVVFAFFVPQDVVLYSWYFLQGSRGFRILMVTLDFIRFPISCRTCSAGRFFRFFSLTFIISRPAASPAFFKSFRDTLPTFA